MASRCKDINGTAASRLPIQRAARPAAATWGACFRIDRPGHGQQRHADGGSPALPPASACVSSRPTSPRRSSRGLIARRRSPQTPIAAPHRSPAIRARSREGESSGRPAAPSANQHPRHAGSAPAHHSAMSTPMGSHSGAHCVEGPAAADRPCRPARRPTRQSGRAAPATTPTKPIPFGRHRCPVWGGRQGGLGSASDLRC